ncbi:MAG: hypothetical protein CMN91_09550 [Synechococcus sp. ARS1019]|nr:hypothetical protein [Synechococcus sp. ARS1019]
MLFFALDNHSRRLEPQSGKKSWLKTSAEALKSGCVSTLTMPEPTLQSWLHANSEGFAVA